jgi:hypothetical protein
MVGLRRLWTQRALKSAIASDVRWPFSPRPWLGGFVLAAAYKGSVKQPLEVPVPWTPERYSASMKHLPEPVLEKAIEIANALLEEGKAIHIAIAKAKEWAEHHGTG